MIYSCWLYVQQIEKNLKLDYCISAYRNIYIYANSKYPKLSGMLHLINLYFTSKRTLIKRLAEKGKIIRYNSWFIRTWAHDQSTATHAINAAVESIDVRGTITQDEMHLLKGGLQLLRDGTNNLVDYLNTEPSAKNEFKY